ncbi:FMN-binding protein [Chloroflexota bacterium]
MPETLRRFMPVMFLTLVVFISVTLLIFTEGFTGPVVEERLRQQIVDKMVDIFPNIYGDVSDYNEETDVFTLYADEGKTEKLGYAFLAIGAGYGGDISILVGLENAEIVKGIIILSHTETPLIGTRAMEPAFLDQFTGIAIGDVAFRKDGGQIDGVTLATVSSSAIIDAVKETAMQKVTQLEGVN